MKMDEIQNDIEILESKARIFVTELFREAEGVPGQALLDASWQVVTDDVFAPTMAAEARTWLEDTAEAYLGKVMGLWTEEAYKEEQPSQEAIEGRIRDCGLEDQTYARIFFGVLASEIVARVPMGMAMLAVPRGVETAD